MIPLRDEAVEVAELNIEQDANKYLRKIESELMVWDGVSEVMITISESDARVCEYLVTALKVNGYTARSAKKPGTSKDHAVYFK